MTTIQAFRAFKAIEKMRDVGSNGYLLVTQAQSDDSNEWVVNSISPALYHVDFLNKKLSRSAVCAFLGNGWRVETLNADTGELEEWHAKKDYYAIDGDSLVNDIIASKETGSVIVVEETDIEDTWKVVYFKKIDGVQTPETLTTEQLRKLASAGFLVSAKDTETGITTDIRTGL